MNVQFHATDQQEKEFQQLTQKVATIKRPFLPIWTIEMRKT